MSADIAKINYQLKLDRIIEELKREGRIPGLLLHSCCGPCSSYVVEYLKDFFNITVLYYNPNIFPEEEYYKRFREQERLLKELGIELINVGYDHSEFLEYIRGLEGEPEGGARCRLCFELRLRKTAEIAREKGFDYYCTTLTVSPHKNSMVINAVGEEIASDIWLPSDFKKRDGYKKSIELSKQYDLYRQNYCGCEFGMFHEEPKGE